MSYELAGNLFGLLMSAVVTSAFVGVALINARKEAREAAETKAASAKIYAVPEKKAS